MQILKNIIAVAAAVTGVASAQIVYEGEAGPGKGKHLVFVASDHEYRAEQACPALAKILAKHHGFRCTVLFGVDSKGYIQGGASNIPGLEVLKEADGLVFFTRFLDLPAEQMQPIIAYLKEGKPIVGLRTSSHAFKILEKDGAYQKFDYRYEGDDFKGGFGEQILGNTWEGHYGRNHRQGTQIQLIEEKLDHPILRGVKDHGFCYAGGYKSVVREGMEVLANSQPMNGMKPDSPLDKKKPPVAFAWTYHYSLDGGKQGRAFHNTQGASEDLLDESYRRMLVNGVYWTLGMENEILADSNVAIVGPYHPTAFKNGKWIKNQKPEDLAGFDSVIGAAKKK
jgi:hypothetical protein